MGRLAIDKSSINVTIEPFVITVIYNPQISSTTTTRIDCMTSKVSTVYITSIPTISSQACMFSQPITIISIYTSTLTATSASIMNTSPPVSRVTITVEKSLPCSAAILPTTQPNQSSLNSSVVVGGVMGYVIFFILCIVGTVGGFFCGRSSRRQQRMTTAATNVPVIISNVNDYEGRRNAARSDILNKNQSLPLPMLPRNNGEEIYDDTGIYMEMDNLQKEMTYENSGAIAAM